MKTKKEKYEEAVERNLANCERRAAQGKLRGVIVTRHSLGIRKTDNADVDDRIARIDKLTPAVRHGQ